eukprot:scaffold8096_cov21-Tisochrysis_lutea.AAC.1
MSAGRARKHTLGACVCTCMSTSDHRTTWHTSPPLIADHFNFSLRNTLHKFKLLPSIHAAVARTTPRNAPPQTSYLAIHHGWGLH